MDLREKLIEDLFDVMHDLDKGIPRFKEMPPADQQRARIIAEGMIEKGWHFDAEKGKQ